MAQFHNIYYKGETDRIQSKDQNRQINIPSNGGSMNALQVAMLEDKIKEYVITELKNVKAEMATNQTKVIK